MPLTFTSYEAKVVEALATMLANSATFRTEAGAADATAAQGKILIGDGGDTQDQTARAWNGTTVSVAAFHGAVGAVRFPSQSTSGGAWERRTGEALAVLFIPPLAASTPPERYVRALNVVGGVRQDLKDQLRGPGAFAHADVTAELYPVQDSPDSPFSGQYLAQLTITWRNF